MDEDNSPAAVDAEDVKTADAAIADDMAKEDTQQTSTEDSSTKETKDAGAKDDSKASDDKTEDGDTQDATDDDADADNKANDTKPTKDAAARKEQLKSEIRDLVSKRNELRDSITNENGKVYQPKTADELIADGMDASEARVKALEDRQELSEFNARVTDLQANLNVESLQVMTDYSMFDPRSPDYNEEFANQVGGLYEKSANIVRDPNTGLIVSANILPYDFYKGFAEAYQQGADTGTVKGQQAADKNEAAAEPTASSKPPTPKDDPFMKGLMPAKA